MHDDFCHMMRLIRSVVSQNSNCADYLPYSLIITHRIESMCIAHISFEVDSVSETMKNDSHKLKFITVLLLRSDGKMPLYSKIHVLLF